MNPNAFNTITDIFTVNFPPYDSVTPVSLPVNGRYSISNVIWRIPWLATNNRFNTAWY